MKIRNSTWFSITTPFLQAFVKRNGSPEPSEGWCVQLSFSGGAEMLSCHHLKRAIWLHASTKEQEPEWGEKYEAPFPLYGKRTRRCPRVRISQRFSSFLSKKKGSLPEEGRGEDDDQANCGWVIFPLFLGSDCGALLPCEGLGKYRLLITCAQRCSWW